MTDNVQDIDTLINIISNEIQQGKSELTESVNIQKTFTYWNIGKHISNHLLYHQDNSNYGQYLFSKLSKALSIGKRTLYFAVQFSKSYQNIDSISKYLTWSHFRILIKIKSDIKRKEYEKLLLDKKLSVRDFYTIVKQHKNNLLSSKGNNLTIYPGLLYLYKIKNKDNKKYLDLGFNIYSDLNKSKYNDFPGDTIFEVSKNKKGYRFKSVTYDPALLYTYKAKVTKVIDGDTIKADIDLGFNNITNKILRFRGINAFEISTKEGKKAKEFVLSKISENNIVIIKTYRPDKYSRYLVDAYCTDDINNSFIETGNNFLNQQLLDSNLAVKYYIY